LTFFNTTAIPRRLQLSREHYFRIISVGGNFYNHGTAWYSPVNYEPVFFFYGAEGIDTDARMQWALYSTAVNYDDCYGLSTGWDGDTGILSDGGRFIASTQSWLDYGFIETAFTNLGHSITGTLNGNEDAYFQVSFDGGTTWSIDLTEAEMQANQFTINGEEYTSNPLNNIQFRMILENNSGSDKTITEVWTTGLAMDSTSQTVSVDDRLITIQQLIEDLPEDVDTELTSTHGAGSWAGGDVDDKLDDIQQSIDTLPTDVDTELTSTHGAGSWAGGGGGGDTDGLLKYLANIDKKISILYKDTNDKGIMNTLNKLSGQVKEIKRNMTINKRGN